MWRPDRNTDSRNRPLPWARSAYRVRRCRRSNRSAGFTMALLLLAFLAEDALLRVFHALALVRLGTAEAADLGRDLAYPLLVRPADRHRGRGLADDLHVLGDCELDLVAVAELQVQDPAVHRGAVADARDLEPA